MVVERRITYQYGVNKNQKYSSIYGSFDSMKQHVEEVTQGHVDVVKREERGVIYGDWEEVNG